MHILSNRCAPVDGRAEGERRRDAAHDLHHQHRGELIRRAQRVLLLTLLNRGTATADDIRAGIDLPGDIDPKCFGSVPTGFARAGVFRRRGFVGTCRPEAHARPVSLWELADPAAAVAWLEKHPDVPPQKRVDIRDQHGQRLMPWEE